MYKRQEQGHAEAQFQCGLRYFWGVLVGGTEIDTDKAFLWYERAARQGHAGAQCRYGRMYDNGEGTETDKAKALYWYEKAAEQGDAEAQYKCGRMYCMREGTAEDRAKARMWLQKAAEQSEVKCWRKEAEKLLREYF